MEESFVDGGTYCVGGTRECHLSITYNYGVHYKDVFPDDGTWSNGPISWLYGKIGASTLDVLRKGVELLGVERSDAYWEATPGNAGIALARLLSFAEKHPSGEWEGD
jgi:hypothetical protein